MGVYEHAFERNPSTRHARLKRLLVVDQDEEWAEPLRDALAEAGYRLSLAAGAHEAIRQLLDHTPDLVVVSTLVGDRALDTLLSEFQSCATPPPVLLVAGLRGERRWEAWRTLPCVSIIRQPFRMGDVVEAARALVGDPWEPYGGAPEK